MVIQKNYSFLVWCSLGVLAAGMLSGYIAHVHEHSWYLQLIKPEFTPPSWIFRPVWTILYLMLGYVLGLLWIQRKQDYMTFVIYVMQLFLNMTWSPIFFGWHHIDLAFFVLMIMWALSIIIFVRASKYIKVLLLPYLGWITFAGLLNYQILIINS